MAVLAIIPARGGSKGVPRKNLASIGGKTLLSRAIDSATGITDSDLEVVVSTDDQEIAAHAESLGVRVEKLRPAHLAHDAAKTIDVVRYEIQEFETRTAKEVAEVILLQPTCPLRTAEDVSQAWNMYRNQGEHSLISCFEGSHVHPSIMYRMKGATLTPLLPLSQGVRRQDFEPVYIRNGAIYISSRDLIMREGKMIAEKTAYYVMSREKSINIDVPADLVMAQFFYDHPPEKT